MQVITTDIHKFANDMSNTAEDQHCRHSRSKSCNNTVNVWLSRTGHEYRQLHPMWTCGWAAQLTSTGNYIKLHALTCYTWYFLLWKQYDNNTKHYNINTVLAVCMHVAHTHTLKITAKYWTNISSYTSHQWWCDVVVNCGSAVTTWLQWRLWIGQHYTSSLIIVCTQNTVRLLFLRLSHGSLHWNVVFWS